MHLPTIYENIYFSLSRSLYSRTTKYCYNMRKNDNMAILFTYFLVNPGVKGVDFLLLLKHEA